MTFCEKCGKKLSSKTLFCENCGAAVNKETETTEENVNAKNIKYCEECGTPASAEASFCENCGHSFQTESSKKDSDFGELYNYNVLNENNWSKKWDEAARRTASKGHDLGIILTRSKPLCYQIGAPAESFDRHIREYIIARSADGVDYYVLDTPNTDDVQGLIDILREVSEIARPVYLMILGNEEIIPVAVWDNQAGDSDEQVFSDIPYSVLDGTSPWEGQSLNTTNDVLRVGRVPSYEDEGETNYWTYFDNVISNAGTLDVLNTYGLSAYVWEQESSYVYQSISNGNVDSCPEYTVENIPSRISPETNLFYFNLHGSDTIKYWVGQGYDGYPKAFSPEIFKEYPTPFFLGVEACYGARYMEGLTAEDSILFSALQNKCLAFLGSTTIAYGTSVPKGSCADIMIGNFLSNIKDGCTAGNAHLEAIRALTAKSEMNDSEIKTYAQFALYGDPSVSRKKNSTGKIKNMMKGMFGVSKGIRINLPDVRKAVHLVQTEIEKSLNCSIDDYVAKNFIPELNEKGINMEEIFQQTSQLTNSGLYVKTYSRQNGDINQIVKVYFDEKGKIEQTLLSK